MSFIKRHLVLTSLIFSFILGAVFSVFSPFSSRSINSPIYLIENFISQSLFLSFCIIYPLFLSAINFTFIFTKSSNKKVINASKIFEVITLVLGSSLTFAAIVFLDIQPNADWNKQLINNQSHTPIYTGSYPTIMLLTSIAFIGYLILSFKNLNNTSPLVIVLSIASLYIGISECILWIIQVFNVKGLLLTIFPANCIMIAVKVIKNKIIEWNNIQHDNLTEHNSRIMNKLNKMLLNSSSWPLLSFILMIPILGIIICILTLLGQQPDAVIKAFTETSDWNLSNRVAPQNLSVDEHYLCTVAAGGHKKIVKPLRLGRRHGHEVIVNRQLCVANAFEQILEEKTPRFHKHLRHFYDTYGFPIAKLIKSPYAADAVYFIMKPLEWFFLIVIYLCDVKPENRIAMQYTK